MKHINKVNISKAIVSLSLSTFLLFLSQLVQTDLQIIADYVMRGASQIKLHVNLYKSLYFFKKIY